MKRKEYWNKMTMGPWEKFYLPEIVRGICWTFSIAAKNLWRFMTFRKGALTVYYPEEKRTDYAKQFRGRHYLTKTETGRPRCIGCKMCQNICPSKAISLDVENSPPGDTWSPKQPARFDLDLAQCIFCGFCVEICPKDAIKMSSKVPNFPCYAKKDATLKKDQLLEFHDE